MRTDRTPTRHWLRRAAAVGAVAVLCQAGVALRVYGEQASGTITGLVEVDAVPEQVLVKVTTDQAVCGDEIVDQAELVGPSGGVANAVIIVTDLPWTVDPPTPVINNTGCSFVPRVQVAKTRSQIEIRSADEILHSTHAYDDRQRSLFNVAVPFPGLNIKRPLSRQGVVRIECDAHDWMRGWVYVTSDVASVTGPDGRFELTGVPPGTYELQVWHERYGGAPKSVTVTNGGVAEVQFTLH